MNDIQALRTHLFSTLTALQDKENPMEIDRAKAVCEVSQVIINSAKAEIDFARVNGSVDTQFFHKPGTTPQLTSQDNNDLNMKKKPETHESYTTKKAVVTIEGNVTTHKMK